VNTFSPRSFFKFEEDWRKYERIAAKDKSSGRRLISDLPPGGRGSLVLLELFGYSPASPEASPVASMGRKMADADSSTLHPGDRKRISSFFL